MSVSSQNFMPIMPRHQRILGALEMRRHVDMFGGIGWKGLLDDEEVFDFDVLFQPLIDRGLIEDLSDTEMGPAGRYFVRITPLGRICNGIGLMLRAPRVTSEAELHKFGVLPFKSAALPAPPPPEDMNV
jgi:hypothetical protein